MPIKSKILDPSFFARDTIQVAIDILGCSLHREINGNKYGGIITEVEAYLGRVDRASHAFRGLTKRNKTLFGEPGHIYVYFIYGMYYCLNFVTGSKLFPNAILIRCLDPFEGTGKCSGPGLVCKSLHIDTSLDGRIISPPYLYVAKEPNSHIMKNYAVTPRIGIDYAGPWRNAMLRFYLKGAPTSRGGK